MRKRFPVLLASLMLSIVSISAVATADTSALGSAPVTVTVPDEPGLKTLGSSIVDLTVLGVDGKPAASAEVELFSELADDIIWRGKTDENGHITIPLREDLSKISSNVVPTNYTIRVFSHDQMALEAIGFVQVKDTTNMTQVQLRNFEHPERYERTVKLDRVQLVPMERPASSQGDASIQVVDELISETFRNEYVKIGEMHVADGLKADFVFGTNSVLNVDVGYKKDGSNWQVVGSHAMTTTSTTETTFSVTGQLKRSDGIFFRAYGMNVYGPYTFRIRRYAHWVDCEGCNLGYYWTEVTPIRYNGGGYVDTTNWYPSYDGDTPSGSQATMDRTVTRLERTFKKGDKWSIAFTVSTAWGNFTGGAAKQYENYTKTIYTVPNWSSSYTRYIFYDRDWSGKMWWVTVE